MPTYDYKCQDCGNTFEHFQAMSDDPLKVCPECGGELKRLIGGGLGVIFKGSGFYVTDNRSGSTAAKKSGSDGGGTDSSKGDGKSSSGESSEKKTGTAVKDK